MRCGEMVARCGVVCVCSIQCARVFFVESCRRLRGLARRCPCVFVGERVGVVTGVRACRVIKSSIHLTPWVARRGTAAAHAPTRSPLRFVLVARWSLSCLSDAIERRQPLRLRRRPSCFGRSVHAHTLAAPVSSATLSVNFSVPPSRRGVYILLGSSTSRAFEMSCSPTLPGALVAACDSLTVHATLHARGSSSERTATSAMSAREMVPPPPALRAARITAERVVSAHHAVGGRSAVGGREGGGGSVARRRTARLPVESRDAASRVVGRREKGRAR